MLFLNNIFKSTFDKFVNFYNNLTDDSRFAFYAIIVLIVVVAILLVILIDQVRQTKKIKEKMSVTTDQTSQSTPDFIFEDETIDEENEKTRNLKEITDKIQEVIDNRNIDLTKFEQDQEENSIISYDELLKTVGTDKSNYKDTETFKLPELARKIEADEIIEEEIKKEEPVRESRFKTSDFISPIYGLQDKQILREEPEQPIQQHEEHAQVLYKNENEESFLTNLKDLRNNLN